MPPKLIFDDDLLRQIVASSTSFWSVTRKIRPETPRGSFKSVCRRIRELGLDTSHFTGTSPQPRSWTDDHLRDAVRESTNVSQVIKRLGLVAAGGNFEHVQRTIKKLGLDTSHFNRSGNGWSKGLRYMRRDVEEILVAGRPTNSHSLKNRLFRAGLKQPCCELCGGRSKLRTDAYRSSSITSTAIRMTTGSRICASSARTAIACSPHTVA